MDVQIFSGIIGNIDTHETKNGNFVNNISVAISKWDNKEKKKKTIWKKVQVWNSNYVKQFAQKGMKVNVQGETCENEWTDKDGKKRNDQFCLVIEGKGVIELHKKNSSNENYNNSDAIEDDIPF